MNPTETPTEALERIIAILEPVTHGWAVEARAIAMNALAEVNAEMLR